ncbi:MAG: MFS transporter [Sulfolobaceae archaeon]
MVTYSRREVIKVAVASAIGTTIEWYDLYIAATAAGVVWPIIYFPSNDPATSILFAVITYGVGFFSRPIGAIVFGHVGDKFGRKSTLVWTLLTMGLGTLGISLTPTYAQIGILGGILIALFRFIQGLGIGGEWGGAVTWLVEHASSSRWRAFWGGWVQMTPSLGLVLSSAFMYYLQFSLSSQQFLDYGWRIPFYVGAIVIAVGVVIRYKLFESPLFREYLEKYRKVERVPLISLLKNQWKTFIILAFVWWYINQFTYIIITFAPSYFKLIGIPSNIAVLSTIFAGIVGIASNFGFSALGDKVGRKKIILASILMVAVYSFLYFFLINTKDYILAIIAQVIAWFSLFGYSNVAAFFAEHYPTKYRYTGTSLSYHVGGLSGAIIPIIASYIVVIGGGAMRAWPYIALLISANAIVSLIALLLTKETYKQELE